MWPVNATWELVGWGVFLVLLWRSYRQRYWSHYPYFCLYLLSTILRYGLIEYFRSGNPVLFALIYWDSDLLVVFLRFCVAWEIFRHTFPAGTALREIAGRVLVGFSALLAIVFSFLLTPEGNFFLDVERKVGLAIAGWVVVLLLLARFYNAPMGRNIWGMAVGMGLYASFSIADFSAFDLKGVLSYFESLLSSYCFLLMLCIWTWALWTYTPTPQLQPVSGPSLDAAQTGWQRSWRKVSAAIRKGLGR